MDILNHLHYLENTFLNRMNDVANICWILDYLNSNRPLCVKENGIRKLTFRSVSSGVVYSQNKEHTIGLFNCYDDFVRVFSRFGGVYKKLSNLESMDFNRIYPQLSDLFEDIFFYKYERFKEVKFIDSQNMIVFILDDDRCLVATPRVLMKEE